jgi:hypothetical protein
MSKSADKPADKTNEDLRNPGITKRVVVRKVRTSPIKLFLRTVYWLITLAILAVVIYISFEAGWLIYKNH